MKKKLPAFSILLIGLLLMVYGLVTAPVSNGAEIQKNYDCGRITKEWLSTDKYCDNLGSAPEAKKDFGNMFVYSGAALALLGGLYSIKIMNSKR